MKKDSDNLRDVAKYTTAAFEMAAVIVIGVLAGVWADDYFATKPAITVLASLLSVAAGIYLFVKNIIKK
ncbi:MAG: AtpZ/AtpI family protein [Bacteroidales bacterium]|nr:AtpZ/AtpI family protein [Bacteroidales bacterium]